jgi:hypothetical protein
MKATLTFNLSEPDDVMNHNRCVQALDMALALWEIRQELFKDEPDIEQIRDILADVNIEKLIQ